eukprot:Platyproteum_vivax@DN5990_c0_g1_i1.p1
MAFYSAAGYNSSPQQLDSSQKSFPTYEAYEPYNPNVAEHGRPSFGYDASAFFRRPLQNYVTSNSGQQNRSDPMEASMSSMSYYQHEPGDYLKIFPPTINLGSGNLRKSNVKDDLHQSRVSLTETGGRPGSANLSTAPSYPSYGKNTHTPPQSQQLRYPGTFMYPQAGSPEAKKKSYGYQMEQQGPPPPPNNNSWFANNARYVQTSLNSFCSRNKNNSSPNDTNGDSGRKKKDKSKSCWCCL